MSEQWKPINEFYDISDQGRVRSWKGKEPRILKVGVSSNGYRNASIHINKKMHNKLVHKLVAKAFLGLSDLQVNHKNGIKTDNRLENLEYVTQSENIVHAYKTGLMSPVQGEKHGFSKLTEKQVVEIFHAKGALKVIAKKYGVVASIISLIKNKKRWVHVVGEL